MSRGTWFSFAARAGLWVALVASAIIFECAGVAATLLRNHTEYFGGRPGAVWGVGGARLFVAIPHEAAGIYPTHIAYGRGEDPFFGFYASVASARLPHEYTKVTMFAVPCWFISLAGAAAMWRCAKLLGLKMIARRRHSRGFDVIIRMPDATAPPPAAPPEAPVSSDLRH